MKKRLLAMILGTVMLLGLLAGCAVSACKNCL